MATELSDNLCFAWSGNFECLKQFVKENLKLQGTWSQPGSDKKLFTFDDSSIIWRKNKNLLYFEGDKASDVMKELCKQICKQDEDISAVQQPSMQNVCEDLESLKLGHSVNAEAIQAVSESISKMVPVIRQFQEFMDKNKKVSEDELWTEPTNKVNESLEYAYRGNIGNDNKAKSCSPIVSKEFTNPIGNNRCENDASSNTMPYENASISIKRVASIEPSNDMTTSGNVSVGNSISGEQTERHQMTYANVVASSPSLKNFEQMTIPKTNQIPATTPQNLQCESYELSSDPDGFIGVKRNRNKTKKFLVTGIDENVKESQILSFLKQRNITPTYISIFKSRRRGTISSKIHVPSTVSYLFQKDDFWPKYISCKPWKSKENVKNAMKRNINATHDGNYSTYV